jgi:hypothetical protein
MLSGPGCSLHDGITIDAVATRSGKNRSWPAAVHNVERAGGEAVLGLQPRDRLAVIAELADDDRDLLRHGGVLEDPARDRRVGGVELDRVQPPVVGQQARDAQRAVTDVAAELERAPRLHALDRLLEDRGLLVADVDQVLVLGS